MKVKSVNLKPATHRLAKMLAVEVGRRLNGDLIDDLVMFGIERYRSGSGVKSAKEVTCTGKVVQKEEGSDK